MTDRRFYWSLALIFLVLSVFNGVADGFFDDRFDRAQERYVQWREFGTHVLRSCKQRDDGSAECAPRTFTPLTTTTTDQP